MANSANPNFPFTARSTSADKRSPLPRVTRILLVVALLAILQAVLAACGVVAWSERWHESVPFAALLWIALTTRGRKWLRRPGIPIALVLGIIGVYGIFWMLHGAQAAYMHGYPDPHSVGFHTVLALSLFTMFWLWRCVLRALWNSVSRAFSRSRQRRATSSIWSEVFATGLGMLTFAPYVFVAFNIHRPKVRLSSDPQRAFHLPFESVAFPAADDGVRLAAWFVPCRGSRNVVIVCNGIGTNRDVFMGVVPFLHRAGCNVLMFDFRGSGDSAGFTTSFGLNEARDVRGAVAYLRQRGFCSVVLYGFSMGGAAALLSMPQLPLSSGVRGVVVDSTFADFRPLVREQSASLPLFGRAVPVLSRALGWLELGRDLDDIVPAHTIGSIAPRPLFIIHGLADSLIPVAQSKQNFAAARPPRAIWLVPHANHCLGRIVNPPPYEKRVTAFLHRCFTVQSQGAG